jgi:hypothetical protein
LRLLAPDRLQLPRRIALAVLLTWVPLLVLSALEGRATGSAVRIPLLNDFSVYARFLVSLPLLILAEGPVGRHIGRVAAHFIHGGLLRENDRPAYDRAVVEAMRRCDSNFAGVAILVLTGLAVWLTRDRFPFDFSTWRSTVTGTAHVRTVAGWWALLVGTGLLSYLFWQWLWRLLVWYGFLWRMSRLQLQLIPTHPDRAGGLSFLGETHRLFWILPFAGGAALSGVLAGQIIFEGIPLLSFKFLIAAYVALVLAVFLGPLLMFAPHLVALKLEAAHGYSALALAHNHLFDRKWLGARDPESAGLLGTPDISSLADLGTSYEVVAKMRPVPFDPGDALFLAVTALLPLAPLLLTVLPLDELAEMVGKAIL